MEFTDLLLLLFIILLILISGIMSGSETALTAVSKPRIISKINQGSKRAIFVKNLIDSKENVISSLLLSNNLVNILASSLATAYLYNLFGTSGILYATILMTTLIVVFAEVLPKIYSINKPNRTALLLGPAIYFLTKLLSPLIYLINII
jgi:Mg2+/Co2+ transporter CorB